MASEAKFFSHKNCCSICGEPMCEKRCANHFYVARKQTAQPGETKVQTSEEDFIYFVNGYPRVVQAGQMYNVCASSGQIVDKTVQSAPKIDYKCQVCAKRHPTDLCGYKKAVWVATDKSRDASEVKMTKDTVVVFRGRIKVLKKGSRQLRDNKTNQIVIYNEI